MLYFLFGDTWGRPGDRDVLAWTESTDPAMILLNFHRAADKQWLPLTVPGISQGGFEVPSGGISIADVMYVVCTTDHTKEKTMGRSVLANLAGRSAHVVGVLGLSAAGVRRPGPMLMAAATAP